MQLHDNLHSTPGPFITQVAQTLANGHHLIQLSRRYRKRLPPLQLRLDGAHIAPALKQSAWLRFWAPLRLAWWIAVLFIIGSVCFAYGSFASNWPDRLPQGLTDSGLVAWVFFIGSLFFTGAAGLQWH
jgi:hypothetical protein